MEKNMDQRSESNGELLYRGVLPVAMSGRLVRCHAWSDGTILPVLAGFDDPDPDDPDPDDPDPDDDEDEEEDDDDDPKNIKDPKRRKAAQEAARYRVQRNEARTKRDEYKTQLEEARAKIKDLEAKGSGDDSLKERIAELEKEAKDKDTKLSELESKLKGSTVERQVASAVSDLKIKDDVDYVVWLLAKEGLDETDEDGTIEDLEKNLKRLVKAKKLSISEDDEDDEPDDDENRTSGRSSGRTMNGKKKSKATLDRAALEKKYPALRR